jgi:modulator of FtsH protease HflC
LRATYGIALAEIGVERLTLPETTLNATVARMRSERETIAVQRTAEGQRKAAEIRADAERDSRVAIAAANVKAADIEAAARREAADIYAKAYQSDSRLYLMLRSLDTLAQMTGPNTRILLRADAAPFDLLVRGPPPEEGETPGPATAASGAPRP